MSSTRALPALIAVIGIAALAGCSADAPTAGGDAGIRIVASTDVYGDIAQTVAGDTAEVTSIIRDSSQDPHEYEATPRDALALADADLVVLNGGGYDEFMNTLLDAHGHEVPVIDAVALSGLAPEGHEGQGGDAEDGDAEDDHAHRHGEINEHVWYSLDAVEALAHELAHELGELAPADAATFSANADALADELDRLRDRAADIAAAHPGATAAITEPVPLYLLELAGVRNVTPDEFSEAVEEGTDAPVLVLQRMLGLVSDGTAELLAYNAQTVGPQTEQVLHAAQDAGTPVASFSELLPEGEHYATWMAANLDAIEAALAG